MSGGPSAAFRLRKRATLAFIDLFNAYFDRYTGGAARPALFDVAAVRPELRGLERGSAAIAAELEPLLAERARLPRYHEVDRFVHGISAGPDPDRSWRVFVLWAMGEAPAAACRDCPRTLALLAGVPDLFQAFFSVLDPGKSIPPHAGPYRGYLRYHLALRVPRERPPRLRVRDVFVDWREGEGFLFDDSLEHEVVNPSGEPRAVLVADVLRPFPPAPHRLNRFLTDHVIRPLYGRGLLRHFR